MRNCATTILKAWNTKNPFTLPAQKCCIYMEKCNHDLLIRFIFVFHSINCSHKNNSSWNNQFSPSRLVCTCVTQLILSQISNNINDSIVLKIFRTLVTLCHKTGFILGHFISRITLHKSTALASAPPGSLMWLRQGQR